MIEYNLLSKFAPRDRKAFTLVELLVVIAIIGTKNRGDSIWGARSLGWQDLQRRGVMGPNVSVKPAQITDGRSHKSYI